MPTGHSRVRLTTGVRRNLALWRHLLNTSEERPTHLHELFLHAPSWFSATDASSKGLRGVFFDKGGNAYVWQLALPAVMSAAVATGTKRAAPSMNNLELAAHVAQITHKSAHMRPLEHTLDSTDSTTAFAWANRGSVTDNGVTAELLRWKAFTLHGAGIASSNAHVAGDLNFMADDASRLIQPSPTHLVQLFNTKYPQKNSWRHAPLTLELQSALITTLSGHQWKRACLPGTKNRWSPIGGSGQN